MENMGVKPMVKVVCRSLFNGNASVGSHILGKAKEAGIPIMILHKGKTMTIEPENFHRFFKFGKDGGKKYPHVDGRLGTYTLEYIKWAADETKTKKGDEPCQKMS